MLTIAIFQVDGKSGSGAPLSVVLLHSASSSASCRYHSRRRRLELVEPLSWTVFFVKKREIVASCQQVKTQWVDVADWCVTD